jgi:glycosyltransferase involved in cell wall biosynthesis
MSPDKPISIGFYCYSTFSRGGDRLVLAYANHLVSLGHDVTLHVKELDTVFEISPEIKIDFIICDNRVGFLWNALSHKLDHDVVIVTIIHLHLFLSRRNNVIYYAQADDVEYYSNKFARALVEILYRIYFKSAKPMISMSQHLTDIFTRRYSAKNIVTIKSGIDHGLFYPDVDKELVVLKGNKKVIVLMARGDSYRKGFDISLRVLDFLDSEVPAEIEIWVCGAQLEQNKFRFNIRNFGVVSDQRLRQILSSADMFIYPSRHEGFGLFPLEAMACGIVAVTTDAVPYARSTPSMRVVDNGDHEGMAKMIIGVIRDAQRLEQLKRQAIIDAAGYDQTVGQTEFANFLTGIVSDGVR